MRSFSWKRCGFITKIAVPKKSVSVLPKKEISDCKQYFFCKKICRLHALFSKFMQTGCFRMQISKCARKNYLFACKRGHFHANEKICMQNDSFFQKKDFLNANRSGLRENLSCSG
jgi:hypothetical protein